MRFLKLIWRGFSLVALKLIWRGFLYYLKLVWKGFLWLLLVMLITMLLVWIYNLDLLGKKPFKFETFKSEEAALNFFEEKFPKGSDALEMMELIKAAGGRCSLDKGPKTSEDFHYDKLYMCGYENNWISRDPMALYTIFMFTDDMNRIISLYVRKQYFLS